MPITCVRVEQSIKRSPTRHSTAMATMVTSRLEADRPPYTSMTSMEPRAQPAETAPPRPPRGVIWLIVLTIAGGAAGVGLLLVAGGSGPAIVFPSSSEPRRHVTGSAVTAEWAPKDHDASEAIWPQQTDAEAEAAQAKADAGDP